MPAVSVGELRGAIVRNRLVVVAVLAMSGSLSNLALADRTTTDTIFRRIPALMVAHKVPGLSIAIIDGKSMRSGGFGTLSAGGTEEVTADTIFEAASLSKPVFTYAFLRLLDRGEMALDRSINNFFPYDRLDHDARGRRITPRHVLSHGTGLPNWERKEHDLPFRFDPGQGFGYSGEGFVYLQKAVESATGQSLNELAAKELFKPLQMTSTSYLWRADFEGRMADGHDDKGDVRPTGRYERENAAYSLYTSANDYIRFVAAIMAGNGLKDGTAKAMWVRQNYMRGTETKTELPPEIYRNIFWGMSWGIQDGGPEGGPEDGPEKGSDPIFWHWGDNETYRSFVAINPKRNSAVVFFTNAPGGIFLVNEIAGPIVGDLSKVVAWMGYE